MPNCPSCNNTIEHDARFCQSCGRSVDAPAPAQHAHGAYGPPQGQPQPHYAAPPQWGQGAPAGMPPRPSNWLVPSILATLFCCLPFGIVAIVFSTQVGSKYDAGDYAGAVQAAKRARLWTLLGAGLGFLVITAWFIFTVLLAASGTTTYETY